MIKNNFEQLTKQQIKGCKVMPRTFTKENALESYQKLIQSITEFQIKQPKDNEGYKTTTNYNSWH